MFGGGGGSSGVDKALDAHWVTVALILRLLWPQDLLIVPDLPPHTPHKPVCEREGGGVFA